MLALLKDYILFAEKDEELQKYILRQHQTTAVEKVVQRGAATRSDAAGWSGTRRERQDLHDDQGGRAAVQGAPRRTSRPMLVMIDRNELEDQMLRNLAALGLDNVEHAHSIAAAEQSCCKDDYRGIVVSMIHKFQGHAGRPQHATEHLRA